MTNKDPRDIIIRPVVSEKSYAAYDNNVYTFVVAPDANKIEIRKAVEMVFGVRVTQVRTQVMRGDLRRVGQFWGKQPFKTFAESYHNQRRVLDELVNSYVVPNIINPLAKTISTKQ